MYQDFLPAAPINDEAKRHNQNLPGLGGVYNYINLHVYHYAGNNPIRYVDPDGRAIWIPLAILGLAAVGLLQSSNQSIRQPDMTVSRAFAAERQLGNIRYNEGGPRPSELRTPNSRDRHGSILLETNPVVRFACSLPRGGLEPGDFSDGKTTNMGHTIGIMVLGGTTMANYMSQSESGTHHTDVRLHYIMGSNGNVSEWNIKITGLDPRGSVPRDIILSRNEAMMYLHNNRERLMRDGIYNQIERLLN
jgi:hypothetical protein